MKNKIHAMFGFLLAACGITAITYGISNAQIPYRAPITSALVNATFGAKDYSNTWSSTNIFQGQFSLDEVVNTAATGSNAAISTTKPQIVLTGALTSVGSIASPATGKIHIIVNRTGGSVTFVNEYGSATAANRIITGTGADVSVPSNSTIIVSYNNNNSRWQIIGGTGGISSLTGDVTATGPGAAAATVASVGGSTASAVNAATVLANAATDASTVSTIVKRDASGISSFDKLKLDGSTSGTVTFQTGTTPTSHSVTVPDTVCSAGQVWQDNGSGVMSCVTPSAGGVNLITNSQAEVNNTGWTCYADAAGTAPVNGDAGSPTVTFTQSSSSPLIGTGSFIYTKDASNRQGEGCAYSFSVDTAYRAKVLQIEFEYLVGSGTFAAGSSSTDSDVTVWLYDVTNSVLIQPTTYKLYASNTSIATRHVSNFQTSATGATYRLILHSGSTSASAYTLKIDDVQVKPSNYVYGTPITDWQTYTPTSSTWLSNVTHTGMWRRVGDSMQAQTKTLCSGAVTNALYAISIPSGYSIDTAKVIGGGQQYYTSISGATASANDSGGGYPLYVAYYSATEVNVSSPGTGGTYAVGAQMSATIPFTWGNTDYVTATFTVPIAGWNSTVQMSDVNSGRDIGVTATTSVTGITTGSDVAVVFTAVEGDSTGSYSTTTGLFTAPEPGDYAVTAHLEFPSFSAGTSTTLRLGVAKNGSVVRFMHDYIPPATATINWTILGSTVLRGVKAGDTIGITAFQNSGSTRTFGGDAQRQFMSITKIAKNTSIGATELVAAKYWASANTTSSTTQAIQFDSKVYDSHNAVTTGASWKFTAPVSGKYSIKATLGGAAASGSTYVSLYKNGTIYESLGFLDDLAARSGNFYTTVPLNAGDYMDIRTASSKAMTGNATQSSTAANQVSIERIGL